MTFYKCKCGIVQSKSTNADNTGNRDTENCQGCPYLLPYGEQEYIKGEGPYLKVKGYECRMSRDLEYASRIWVRVDDKTSGYVSSLDYDFLQQISAWIKKTYPNGELHGDFSRENIRPTDFSSNGRYRYPFYCSQNRAGMAAKAALLERFFNPDGSRKDMTPQEEEAKILKSIEDGKKAAREAADDCNSCQTGGEKQLTAHEKPVPAPAAETAPDAPAGAAPTFDTTDFDWQTVSDLQLAEREYRNGQRLAEVGLRRMADGVAIAHEALVTFATNCRKGDTGQFDKQTVSFGAWCDYMGINRKAAERLLNVAAMFHDSSPRQQKVLEELSPSLLYAAARPSAPAELVEQVKSGDITTHKQYQELLAEKKAAEKQVNILKNQNEYMQKVCEDEIERAKRAEKNAADLKETADLANTEAALARASEETMRSQYTELINEQNGYLTRIAELESRPIEATVVQPPSEEQLAAIRQQADAEARQKYDQLIENVTKDRKQLQDRADTLAVQLRELKKESRMPGMDTVYPMCRDYARSIATFQSTFLMVGAGLDKKEFSDCARELMDAAEELRCVLQATMDDRDRTTQKEDDLF